MKQSQNVNDYPYLPTGYLIDEIAYCSHCVDETVISTSLKIFEHQKWEEQPTCYKCGDSIEVQILKPTFELHHLDTNEVVTFFDECRVGDYLRELSFAVNDWTPMFQEEITEDGEFTMFVHSDSWDDEEDEDGYTFYSEDGEKAWEDKGYNLSDDDEFWAKFQEEFQIKVVPVKKEQSLYGLFFNYDMPLASFLKHRYVIPMLDEILKKAKFEGDVVHLLTEEQMSGNVEAIFSLTASVNHLFEVSLHPEFFLIEDPTKLEEIETR